jgi:hypothetical protein
MRRASTWLLSHSTTRMRLRRREKGSRKKRKISNKQNRRRILVNSKPSRIQFTTLTSREA